MSYRWTQCVVWAIFTCCWTISQTGVYGVLWWSSNERNFSAGHTGTVSTSQFESGTDALWTCSCTTQTWTWSAWQQETHHHCGAFTVSTAFFDKQCFLYKLILLSIIDEKKLVPLTRAWLRAGHGLLAVSITAHWSVSNHSAWWQRHTGVSSLPKATTLCWLYLFLVNNNESLVDCLAGQLVSYFTAWHIETSRNPT